MLIKSWPVHFDYLNEIILLIKDYVIDLRFHGENEKLVHRAGFFRCYADIGILYIHMCTYIYIHTYMDKTIRKIILVARNYKCKPVVLY